MIYYQNYPTYILLVVVLLCTSIAYAQKNERDYIRRGNRSFKDSLLNDAEVNYRKAIELNPSSVESAYNLGNTLLLQDKGKEALQQYQIAAKIEKTAPRLAQIHHNAGVTLQQQKQYAEAIEMYKEALRKNPHDHETRYNLALCQHQLKNNQNDDDNKDQENKEKEDKKEQEKKEDKKEQNNDSQQSQKDQKQDPKQEQNEISKQNAEQLLNAILQDERKTQEKVQRARERSGSRKLPNDW